MIYWWSSGNSDKNNSGKEDLKKLKMVFLQGSSIYTHTYTHTHTHTHVHTHT